MVCLKHFELYCNHHGWQRINTLNVTVFFFNCHNVYFKFLSQGRTVNREDYKTVLQEPPDTPDLSLILVTENSAEKKQFWHYQGHKNKFVNGTPGRKILRRTAF